MLLTGKDRPSRLPERVEQLRAHVRSEARFGCVTGLLVVGVPIGLVVGGFAWFDEDAIGFPLTFAIMIFIFGGIAWMNYRSRVHSAKAKVDFVDGVLREFQDDVHPASKLHYHVDLRPYDADDKRYWSGTSQHGNSKYRYDDRWFRAKLHLVDGTAVVLERRADVKVRKGSVVKDKRRLYVKVMPNAKTFGSGPYQGTDLEKMVEQTIREAFHDPPEGLKIAREADRPDLVALKVTQLDADFLPREVLVLVEAVLLYLRMRA